MLADYIEAIDGALRLHGSRTGLLIAEQCNAIPRGFALLVEATGRRARAKARHVSQIAVVGEQETPVHDALTAAVAAWALACGSDVRSVDAYWRGHPAWVARLHR